MRKSFRNVTACMLALLALVCVMLTRPTSALAEDSSSSYPTVRVGISEYSEYAYYDANGNPTGADVEYAYKIAEYANLNIQVVLIPDAESYFQALDDGTVDMLFDVDKTPEREQKYLFADYETGKSTNSVFVRKDDDRFTYGDIDQLKDKVFGVEKDSNVTDLFIAWCQGYGFTPTTREYSSADAIDLALDQGEIDAGVIGDRSVSGYRTIEQFSPTPYYSIFRSDETGLKEKVDSAMSRILSEDPLFGEELVKKYQTPSDATDVSLSAAEKAYVAEHPTIKVAVIAGDAPYYSTDSDGSDQGILVDYYESLSEMTGLSFEFVAYDSQDKASSAVLSGSADVLGMYSDGLVNAHAAGFRLTNSYSTVSAVEVTRAGTSASQVKTVAAKKRSIGEITSAMGSENVSVVGYNTAKESFEALQRGDVDAMVCGMPTGTWLVNQANSTGYDIVPLSDMSFEICGAVAYQNDTLCSIIDKAEAAQEGSFDDFVAGNTLRKSDWRTFISSIPPFWIALIGIILTALVVALIAAVVMLIRRQREAAAVAQAKAENQRKEAQLAAEEEANDERNQFFSNISHDMRTPLNAIIGFSTLAQKNETNPEVKGYLSKIQTSGNVLLNLIDDTLTVSKMNSGKLKLNEQPVALAKIMDSIEVPIQEFAAQHGVEFIVDMQARERMVVADQLNVDKIFLNLLTNAVKYTPRGGHVHFIVSDDPVGGEDPDLTFIVADDGVGIADDFLPHIYEPFVQENKIGTSSGTGLGLSIVDQLVGLMKGTIEVESEQGKGTTFTVRLHLDETDEQDPGAEESQADGVSLSGKKVLLCEDNAMNAEIARALLSGEGMEVVSAGNGRVGLRIFSTSGIHEFDAVLMDVRMPVMDGLEATRQIRALDRADAATVPIIAMTADAFADDVQRCMKAGMNAHVSKPIDPARLKAALAAQICK